jgi:mono/diheme cytochrome c family protein
VRLTTKRQFANKTSGLKFIAYYVYVSILLTIPAGAWALNAIEYDARLCSAGIVVLGADIEKKLLSTTPENQGLWLQERINGTLSTLPWLCRRYAELNKLDALEMRLSLEQLKHSVAEKNWGEVRKRLVVVSNLSPLKTRNLKPGNASESAHLEGEQIYSRYCKACHFRPLPGATPPIFSLSGMARNLPEKEFIARMIVGVHGTPEISLQNPLSDGDISGMFAYLLTLPYP